MVLEALVLRVYISLHQPAGRVVFENNKGQSNLYLAKVTHEKAPKD
jgi:hypothetical protein